MTEPTPAWTEAPPVWQVYTELVVHGLFVLAMIVAVYIAIRILMGLKG